LLLLVYTTVQVGAEPVKLTIALNSGSGSQTKPPADRYSAASGVLFESTLSGGGTNAYNEKLLVQIVSGSAPDIFYFERAALEKMVKAGGLLNLDKYYARDVKFADYIPAFGSGQVGNSLYAIPAMGGGYRIDGFFVNRDIFNAAGLPIPSPKIEQALTYKQLTEIARRLTIDKSGDGVPEQFGVQFELGENWRRWLPSNGAMIFNDAQNEVLVDRPEAIEVLQLLQDLNFRYRVQGGTFSSGNVALTRANRGSITGYTANIGDKFDWSVAPVEAGRAGSVGSMNFNLVGISANTKYPDEAWKYLKYLISEQEQDWRAAQGLSAVLRKSIAKYMKLSAPPYDLTPFLEGPTVERATRLDMPGGEPWPAEAVTIWSGILNGTVNPTVGAKQTAEILRGVLAGMK
jgi:multiple sugar transport system substrate-binding protein